MWQFLNIVPKLVPVTCAKIFSVCGDINNPPNKGTHDTITHSVSIFVHKLRAPVNYAIIQYVFNPCFYSPVTAGLQDKIR